VTGPNEVARLKQILDQTFVRIGAVTGPLELQSDYARYLCVLVAGYFERATVELAAEWVRRRSDPRSLRYVVRRLERFQNPKKERVLQLLADFEPTWRTSAEAFIIDARADALGSVMANRNRIAHGDPVTLSYSHVSDWYKEIQEIVDFLASLFDPP
jgi:hypothetical protein